MPKTCQSCSGSIPSKIKIDGVWKGLSCRRYCLKCKPYKSGSTRRLKHYKLINGEEYKRCSRCKQFQLLKEYSVDRRGPGLYASYCKPCYRSRHIELKQKCVDHMGGTCFDCKNSFEYFLYDLHHIDPTKKDFAFGKMKIRDWDKLKIELDKCVLLCAHCHRKRHYDANNPNFCHHRNKVHD